MPDTPSPQTGGDRLRHLQRLGLTEEAREILLRIYGSSFGDPAEVLRRLDVSKSTLKRWKRNLDVDDEAIREAVRSRYHG